MSADNGVYVLVSHGRKTRHGHKTEYRVAYAQAIENIWYGPDYPMGTPDQALTEDPEVFVFHREEVLSYFGGARVFTDRRIAEGYAQRMFDEYISVFGIVEYGIVWLDQSAHIPFPKQQLQVSQRQRSRLSAVS